MGYSAGDIHKKFIPRAVPGMRLSRDARRTYVRTYLTHTLGTLYIRAYVFRMSTAPAKTTLPEFAPRSSAGRLASFLRSSE